MFQAICKSRILLIVLVVTLAFLVRESAAIQQTRPNVILIMTDDQGWGDVEFAQQLSPAPLDPDDQTYAGHPELKTPELAAMASQGLKFNRFYSACPVCSPTRASFLTGRHYRRIRIDHANVGRMLNREVTIAELAKTIGYTTGHFGKWHLGTLDKSIHPIDSNRGGTDRLPSSATNFAGPWNDRYDTIFATESKTQTFNPTDLSPTTHYWEGFEQSLATTDPSLDGDDSRVMMDRVIPFVQSAVSSNEPFLATIWFHTPHKPYDTIDNATLDEFYSPAEQAAMNTNERGYYACLTAMDKQVGRLRQTLANLGVANDTLIVFTSDNGPENGVPGIDDVAKGFLRGNKRHLFEGGVRVPTIVEWPGEITPDTSTDCIAGVIDLLPTLLEIWDIEMPDSRPLDGESILPLLQGNTNSRNKAMFWDFVSSRSILDQDGRFKAISTNNGTDWALYDLIADPKESDNLANSNQSTLNSLVDQWNTWRTEVDVQRAVESDYQTYIYTLNNAGIDNESPPSFLPADQANDSAVVFTEKQFYALTSDIAVDADGAEATYDKNNQPTGAVVSSGQTVHSYLLHLSPLQTIQRNFSVTFENEILGVVTSEPVLEATDFLAYANPTFFETTTGNTLRGLDFHNTSSNDGFSISADSKTISVLMQSTVNTLDEIRVITSTGESGGPQTTVVTSISQSDARQVGFTTNSRDDNNGGGSISKLIGRNTEGVENFAVFKMDLGSLAGEVTTGATVSVSTETLNNSNHGSANDAILLNTLAMPNVGFETGTLNISNNDNLTDDGSISFLNRIQYNDSPGPPSGTTQPWLNEQGVPVSNLVGAISQAGIVSGYEPGNAPVLSFTIDQSTAQSWIDNGLIGLVLSAADDGDSRSRFSLLGPVTIAFEIQTQSFVPPSGFTVLRGVDSGALLSDFVESDDVYAEFEPGFVLNNSEAPVWLVFDAVASNATKFLVESNANTPGLNFTAEAWNWSAGSYDVIGEMPESFNADALNEFDIDSQNHIDSGGQVRSRIGWRKVGFTVLFPWQVQIDQLGWNN